MAYTALLDACVLYPPTLRDILLRLGERRLYRPLWSGEILEEMVWSILRDRPDLREGARCPWTSAGASLPSRPPGLPNTTSDKEWRDLDGGDVVEY